MARINFVNAQTSGQLGYALIKSSADCKDAECLHTSPATEQMPVELPVKLDKLRAELHHHDLMSLLQFMVTLGVIAVAWFFR